MGSRSSGCRQTSEANFRPPSSSHKLPGMNDRARINRKNTDLWPFSKARALDRTSRVIGKGQQEEMDVLLAHCPQSSHLDTTSSVCPCFSLKRLQDFDPPLHSRVVYVFEASGRPLSLSFIRRRRRGVNRFSARFFKSSRAFPQNPCHRATGSNFAFNPNHLTVARPFATALATTLTVATSATGGHPGGKPICHHYLSDPAHVFLVGGRVAVDSGIG
jgi:hypothetical protein